MDDVLRRLVISYLLDGYGIRDVSRRLGIGVNEVSEVLGSSEYRDELLRRREEMRIGVDGCVELFRVLVRDLLLMGEVDVGVKMRIFELLLRYCGFGDLLRGYVGGVISGGGVVGGGGIGGVYDIGE